MAAKRVPLSDVANAANSPARHLHSLKRSRDQAVAQENIPYDLQPQAKRQAFDIAHTKSLLSPAKQSRQLREDRVLARPVTSGQPSAFERRLLAARDNGTSRSNSTQQRVHRQEKTPQEKENMEDVRMWQKHYKKAFPKFIFYFEGLTEDARQRCLKTIRSLGAREEKFFSKEVTHVVTSRSVPLLLDNKDSCDTTPPAIQTVGPVQSKSINPSLLDRPVETQSKGRFNFEAPSARRPNLNGYRDVELKKAASNNVDILSRAQDLGIKVWQVEKLQRITNFMSETPKDAPNTTLQQIRATANGAATKSIDRGAELSRMLRNERLHGPSDRDVSVTLNELVPFKGPYIYIRDIDERTKPVMVKEWAKPGRKGETGDWPQFRAVSHGKCPFVEEITKEDIERELALQEQMYAQQQKMNMRGASRSRAATPQAVLADKRTNVDQEPGPPVQPAEPQQQPLQELSKPANIRRAPPERPTAPQFCPPPSRLPPQMRSPLKVREKSATTVQSQGYGYEPAASGLQPASNITSAIRSQVISSTTSAPGVKAGTSKEIHGLKRKVLEKNAGPALSSIQARHQQLDRPQSTRAEAQIAHTRQGARHTKETLVQIHEESTRTEDEDIWLAEDVRASESASTKTQREKNTKPGYCENCREKYDDFDDHVVGRRHRKFALNPDNWKDLDRLLAQLVRPEKEAESDDF